VSTVIRVHHNSYSVKICEAFLQFRLGELLIQTGNCNNDISYINVAYDNIQFPLLTVKLCQQIHRYLTWLRVGFP
jgi:hypothetical protein